MKITIKIISIALGIFHIPGLLWWGPDFGTFISVILLFALPFIPEKIFESPLVKIFSIVICLIPVMFFTKYAYSSITFFEGPLYISFSLQAGVVLVFFYFIFSIYRIPTNKNKHWKKWKAFNLSATEAKPHEQVVWRLVGASNPGKLANDLNGYNKKNKLGLKGLSPEDVDEWLS